MDYRWIDINCQVVNDLPAGYARKVVERDYDVHSAADDQLLYTQRQVNHIVNMFFLFKVGKKFVFGKEVLFNTLFCQKVAEC